VPAIRSPIIGTPTVPPPPTRFNSTVPGTTVPADTRPNLAPGSTIIPGTTVPSNTFPTTPAPGGSFNPSFPSGTNYPPAVDPYSSGAAIGTPQPRTDTPTGPILTQPEAPRSPALNSSVQPVPDPDAGTQPRPVNRAPQLLDPRDKTARAAGTRWAVVPAIWPAKSSAVSARNPEKAYSERSYSAPHVAAQTVAAPALNPADFDDSGWKSAR
jgi:hypothetical protein